MDWFFKAFRIAFGVGLGWIAAPFVIVATLFLIAFAFLTIVAILEWIGDMWYAFRYRFFPTEAQKLKKERLSRLR